MAEPDRRAAGGVDPVTVTAPNFQLEGKGWNWRSTPSGDTFAVLEAVHANLLPGKPGEAGIRVSASRVDVVAVVAVAAIDPRGVPAVRFVAVQAVAVAGAGVEAAPLHVAVA